MQIQHEILARGTGATVLGIKASLLKQVPIYFPKKISEQMKIAAKIEEISEIGERLEIIYQQKLDNLAALKQAILQKAFAAELTAQPEKALREVAAA
jgi:type I restriction enzyme, S subunit